jgi:serine/threonine-protein kinase
LLNRLAMPESALQERTVLAGRYEVLETLGGGGFGVVHKAWDRLLHRTVAIKVVRPETLAAGGRKRDEVVKRFEREATTAAGLTHPAIVTVYDVGLTGGAPYLAMEYVDSVGLDRVIARERRLPAERAALIALEVTEALEYAHGHGVLHRDVKPQNIVVPRSGARPVKLVDFGLAKALDCTDHLTRTGTFLGTPSYASPEQVGGEPLDGRSDVWSLGCVLYEMLTGQKAFSGVSITSVVAKIMTVEPRAVRELDPDVPEELARIVGKAMAKEPGARYASAGDLAADLRHFVRTRTPACAEVPAADPQPAPAERVPEATVVAVVPAAPTRIRSWRGLALTGAAAALALAGAVALIGKREAPEAASPITPPTTMAVAIASPATPEPAPVVVAPTPATGGPAPAPLPAVKASASRASRGPSPRLPVRAPLELVAAPPPATAPPAEDPSRPFGQAELDTPPRKVALELPAYPRRAPPLRRGQTLSVTLSYVVATDGSVSDIGVTRSSGVHVVDEAVADAARRARYRPAMRGGAPLAMRVSHTFSFRGE